MRYNNTIPYQKFKALRFLVILFFCSTVAFSQEIKTTSITGQVIDNANEIPVENVIIKLIAVKDSTQVIS